MNNTKRIVALGIFIAMALIIYVVEAQIPIPIPIPGVKLGLANIISLLVLLLMGWKEALIVVILRIILGSIFTGGVSAMLFSIVGGLLSNMVMILVYKFFKEGFSLWSISIIGSIFHNIGQLMVAAVIIQNLKIYLYLPVLLVAAVITGYFVGISTKFIYGHLTKLGLLNN